MEQFVVMCPCCNSPVDVETGSGDEGQPQEIECVGCGQIWQMIIDPARMAEYSNA